MPWPLQSLPKGGLCFLEKFCGAIVHRQVGMAAATNGGSPALKERSVTFDA
jgi:hypothetical protein